MDIKEVLKNIKKTESPLKRQLLMVALVSYLLKRQGKDTPVVIGGCALSYYSREVFFTADIDLAYADREALDAVLKEIGFDKKGRYWVNEELGMAIESPASILAGEDAPIEIVEFGEDLQCKIIGIEDLIIDRLNACKHWKSQIDCEMAELLIRRYQKELDWDYTQKKAIAPHNDTLSDLLELRSKAEK
ncbi:MAG: hypothetical protein QME90_02075 [Thermodesulfobacteriota bacterium]|nr:hypothetical protein [Thermodesulfobacteriota bacterium]